MYLKVEKRKAFTEKATESCVTGRWFGLRHRISVFCTSKQVGEETVSRNNETPASLYVIGFVPVTCKSFGLGSKILHIVRAHNKCVEKKTILTKCTRFHKCPISDLSAVTSFGSASGRKKIEMAHKFSWDREGKRKLTLLQIIENSVIQISPTLRDKSNRKM
jgi:hypothetical protein